MFSVKRELILRRILFIFGIVLATVSLVMLVLQIINTVVVFSKAPPDNFLSYSILQFSTIIFKIVLSLYAIYALKNIDDIINPLFTFTILYVIFVVLQSITFFVAGGFKDLDEISSINELVDLGVATIFLTITLIFKIDDWRPYKKD